ncbi:MAG TPA: hypothetical protein VGC42_11835 [Kofleriaceae bacterium]
MRSWVVVPAMGVVCGGAAIALDVPPTVALAGAAIAAVVRVLAGDSPAALTGAVLAPLLAVASWASLGAPVMSHAVVAVAAAAWAIAELARGPAAEPLPPEPGEPGDAEADEPAFPFSPLVAVAPAIVAAVLDPRFVALIAIAGARLMTLRWDRPRWAVAVPLAGAAAILLALIAPASWPALALAWFGGAASPAPLSVLAARAGEALGPLTAVAGLAGLAALVRARYAEAALAAALAGAVLVDLRAGAPGTATVGLAALLAGLAIGRLAGLIRIPSGQAITGATLVALIVLPPAWTAIERRSAAQATQAPPAAHTARASR